MLTILVGGGLNMKFEKNRDDLEAYHCTQYIKVLTVSNTTFTGNKGDISAGAIWVTYYERSGTGCTVRQVEFIDCIFTDNISNRGAAIQVSKHKVPIHQVHNVPQFSVTLRNCLIKDNHLTNKTDQINEDGIIEIFSVEKFVIISSRFVENNGTALMMVNSGVQFYNKTIFKGNTAAYGGALKLCESSVIYLDNYTRVEFLNNIANLAGGAIYAGNQCLQEAPPCFFQISFKNSSNASAIEDLARGLLYFEGNYAGIAGHSIYGGSVDNCFTDIQLRVSNKDQYKSFYHSLELYRQIFNFSNQSEVSLVTSDP